MSVKTPPRSLDNLSNLSRGSPSDELQFLINSLSSAQPKKASKLSQPEKANKLVRALKAKTSKLSRPEKANKLARALKASKLVRALKAKASKLARALKTRKVYDRRRLCFNQLLSVLLNSFSFAERLVYFQRSWKIFLDRFYGNKPMIYPDRLDSFYWPQLQSESIIFQLNPREIWGAYVTKGHRLYYLAEQLVASFCALGSSPLIPLFGQLLCLTFNGWLASNSAFYQQLPLVIPCDFVPSSIPSRSLHFFFRPTWDVYDQEIDWEHCFDDLVSSRDLWTEFLFDVLPSLKKPVAETFLLQFVEREHRFWDEFVQGLINTPPVSDTSLVLEYIEVFYPFIKENPTWTLYLLERLTFILPFLPRKWRSFFFRAGRVLRIHCRAQHSLNLKKLQAQQEKESPKYTLSLMLSWFKRQRSYVSYLQEKSVFESLFQSSLEAFISTMVYPWISVHRQPLVRLLKQRLDPWVSKRRRFFLNQKLKSYQRLTLKKKSIRCRSSYVVGLTCNLATSWSLLLLWSLVFYLKLQAPKSLFFFKNWLLTWHEFPLVVQNDSLKSLYDVFLQKFPTEDSLFTVACAYWSSDLSSGSSRRVFHQKRLRRFFMGGYRPKKESAYAMYRRFQYLRQVPFSLFCDLWRSSHSRQFSKYTPLATPVLVTPLSLVSSPYGSRAQLPLMDPSVVFSSHRIANSMNNTPSRNS